MPTGLDVTGEVSDVYMLWWDETFLELLKSVDVEMDVFARFKDDINNILDELNCEQNEKIWNLDCMRHLSKPQLDDNYTANVLCLLANSVDQMISFTVDTPHMNCDKKTSNA